MKRFILLGLVLCTTFTLSAQQPSCAAAAANVATILTSVQTLLDDGNIEGANTLLNVARDTLQNCEASQADGSASAVDSPTIAPTMQPASQAEQAVAATDVPPQATDALVPTSTASSPSVLAPDATVNNVTINAPDVRDAASIAFVHFAHTSVDVGPIDLYMDNDQQPIVANLSYGDVTDLVWIASGDHTFTARPAGTGVDGARLYRVNWNYLSNSTWIVVAAGIQEELAFIVEPISILRNNYNEQARVRVINLIAGAPRLTVADNTGRVLGNGLGWVGLRDTLVPAGRYTLNVSTSDGRIVDSLPEFNFMADTTTTLLTMGRGTSEQPVTFLPLVAQQEETRVRFINDGADPIEIYMRPGNQLLVTPLDPAAETEFIALPSGAATFISYAPGSGPTGQELAALARQLRPGRDMTISVQARSMVVQDVSLRLDS